MVEALERRADTTAYGFDRSGSLADLERELADTQFVFHLAGVNRPRDEAEFAAGNFRFTERLCELAERSKVRPTIVFASSSQAGSGNPYGDSKLAAEEALGAWVERSGGAAVIFRIRNVFGKWCRPNYNSVTATFCYNVAHDLPLTISDPARELELIYIDDVVAAFMSVLENTPAAGRLERREIPEFSRITLGELAAKISAFRESRTSLVLPAFNDEFTRRLYATYVSYLDSADFAYPLDQKTDPRGMLAEFMKSDSFGQIFVSRTKPGITRGNHYHHTKTEKFLVVEGDGVIRLRAINGSQLIEHRVSGEQLRVVDIPPGFTHSIQNVGADEMVTLFWASEVFNPEKLDTIPLPVEA